MLIPVGPDAQVRTLHLSMPQHACEVHSETEDVHPASMCYQCFACGNYFYFCDMDGPATLRMLKHPTVCPGLWR